jgi:hypothetical protein
MKKSPLQRIEELISVLPGKDAELSKRYLKERNFGYILEIVESDIYKRAKKAEQLGFDDTSDDMATLLELKDELMTYTSYLDVPDNSDDYDYFT